jgi:hypothetical protein
MIASRPEAEAKYSRGRVAFRRLSARQNGRSERDWRVARRIVQAVVLIGAAALVVAEFEPLYRVRTDVGRQIVRSVSAGSHHSYALLPVAVLAALLAGALGRSRWPVPAALALLGLAALGIALFGDLPEVHRAGVVGTPATGLHDAHTVTGAALYLETLGAIALLAAGVVGLIVGHTRTTPPVAHSPAASGQESGSRPSSETMMFEDGSLDTVRKREGCATATPGPVR